MRLAAPRWRAKRRAANINFAEICRHTHNSRARRPAPRPSSAMQAIRATLIGIAYLMMNGLRITHMPTRDFFVAVWGGLRGAVGLALGLLVFKDTTICENIRNKVTADAHAPSHRPCP